MPADPIVIVGAARTPMGGFLGDLKDVSAPALGARAIFAAVERAGLAADSVDEILMGCVLPAGRAKRPRVRPPSAQDCPSRQGPPRSTRCAARA